LLAQLQQDEQEIQESQKQMIGIGSSQTQSSETISTAATGQQQATTTPFQAETFSVGDQFGHRPQQQQL
jgi:hypothetical protein